jgi:hypothetical protein
MLPLKMTPTLERIFRQHIKNSKTTNRSGCQTGRAVLTAGICFAASSHLHTASSATRPMIVPQLNMDTNCHRYECTISRSEAPTARIVPISRLLAQMRADRVLFTMLAQMAKKSIISAPAAIKRPYVIFLFSLDWDASKHEYKNVKRCFCRA